MLSIGLLRGGHDIGSYYAKDDYYGGDASRIENGQERERDGAEGLSESLAGQELNVAIADSPRGKGQWAGRGATALGLSGSVDPEVLNALIKGRLPNGVELGTRRQQDGSREHTGGWDLTFSAPKSVSVLAEISGDRELFRAHNEAVKEAIGWLEVEAAALRRAGWLGSKTERTGNLVVALFQHDTSREQDPQLHTHALVLNATQRSDGKWRSVFSLPLYEHQLAGGNVYRAALAERLQVMGFQIERTHADGRFEVVGVPADVLKEFSTRRAQIEEKLAGWNAEGPQASEKAALLTRGRKQVADLPALRTEWNVRARSLGFDVGSHIGQVRQSPSVAMMPTGVEENRILRAAVDRLSEREAAFTHAHLMAATLAEGMGEIDVGRANQIIARNTRYGGLELYEARIGERKAWTTPLAKEQERRYENQVKAGLGAVTPAVPRREAQRALKGAKLNASQKAAVELITSSSDRFVAVVGRPGTGKTTMIAKAEEILESNGFTAIGMAPNGAAAKELATVGGLAKSRTIASQLARIGRRVGSLKRMDAPERAAALAEHRKEVWVVDEASQVSNADMRRLVKFATLTGARIAFVGDPAQLGAINAGKPFARLLNNEIRHVVMDKIFRQTHEIDREIVKSAIDRDIDKAMQLLDPNIQTIGDEAKRHWAMVRDWATSKDRVQTLMITMRNSSKTELNDMARHWLRENGQLKEEFPAKQLLPVFGFLADRERAATYREGDVIRFDRKSPRLGIDPDTYWYVTAVEGKDSVNRVTLSDGEHMMTLNPRTERTVMRKAHHYRPRETSLAANDRIVWSRNDYNRDLVNGQILHVVSIKSGVTYLATEDRRVVPIRTDVNRTDQHWEHAYASSLYKSQGKTAERVLLDAPTRDANLLNHHGFVVGVSRHRTELKLFTDDPQALKDRVIRNPGDKTSSLEGLGEGRMEELRTTLESVSRLFGPKEEIVKKEEIVEQFAPDRNRVWGEIVPPRGGPAPQKSVLLERLQQQKAERERVQLEEQLEQRRGPSMSM